jgi:ABC-2 type transport system permease protein
MLHLLLWQKALVRRNELLHGTWRRRIGWLVGIALGAAFIGLVFTVSLGVFVWVRFAQPEATSGLLVGGFALMTTFALFWGLGTALSDLYLSSDLELLMTAPVPRRDIFWLKLLGEMGQTGLAALIPMAVLVAYGVSVAAGWHYYVAAAVVWVLVLAMLVAVSMALVMLLMRVMPAKRAREIYSLIYVIFFAAIWLGWMILSRNGRTAGQIARLSPQILAASSKFELPPASWAGGMMLAWTSGDWARVALNGLPLVVLAVAAIGLAYLLFERSFHRDWAAMHEVAARPRHAQPVNGGNGARPARSVGELCAAWLPWPARQVAAKDWTIFPRDLRQVSRLIMPLVVSLFYVYQFGFASPVPRAVPGIGFWLALFVLPVVPIFFALAVGTPAIGKEGGNFELLRVAPLSPGALLWGKVWMTLVPTVALGLAATLTVALLLRTTGVEIALLLILVVLISLALSAIAVALGALVPNFQASDYRRVVGPLASYGTILGGVAVWVMVLGTLAVVAIHLPFNAGLTAGLQRTLGRGSAILWLLGSPLSLLLMGLLDLAGVAALALLWRYASWRIATWQPTD